MWYNSLPHRLSTVNNSPVQGYAHPDSNRYSTFLWDTCNIIIRFCFCVPLEPLSRVHPQDQQNCVVRLRFVNNFKKKETTKKIRINLYLRYYMLNSNNTNPRDTCFLGKDMCFRGRGTHITRDMCFPRRGTHITRDKCFSGKKTQNIRDMCFPGRETAITRDMCLPCRGAHITKDMCFPGRGTHVTTDTSFPRRGTHITRDMCFPGTGTQITRDMCFPGRGTQS